MIKGVIIRTSLFHPCFMKNIDIARKAINRTVRETVRLNFTKKSVPARDDGNI
ncbi:MAG: hypothetical protein JSV21_10900 [Nitrospirota bacterium]|nr:MAG: hypothetical protein JSV21_10900 [Nitrospirota bacterium]